MAQQTAYPSIERELRRQVRAAALDHAAFQLPLRICDLRACRATCCHDGVFLDPEEVGEIDALIARHPSLPQAWHETRDGRTKTATRPAVVGELAADFPAHFPKCRCIFLDSEHRCRLQRLSEAAGHHPWWWKPVSCWLHPLSLRADRDRPRLTLAQPGLDPAARPDYPGFTSFTPCGRACHDGQPAWQTLQPELDFLGAIADRDLVAELRTHPSYPG